MSASTQEWLASILVDATRLLMRSESYAHNVDGHAQVVAKESIERLCKDLMSVLVEAGKAR